ncbi:hypothetical protein CVT24_008847 [Panaeolus cyanescens]|uniref:Phosphatidylinositol-specific phospholipase C X domain-containing protein n=1 Tax=Panaeolus cyanescens TaxID=181874 RepID=A0A409VAU3_9AGAR|nr:hypothetical protein CVT24_008847 [Panaeolus cyanescens]
MLTSLSLRLAAISFFYVTFLKDVALGAPMNMQKRDQLCNGHAELCERPYGNTTFLASHDSFAVSTNPFALARTQEVDLETQLLSGVRMLQAQGRMNGKDLHFCHTCESLTLVGLYHPLSNFLLFSSLFETYLETVKSFLDRHPNEVLTLVFVNPEEISVKDVWKPIFEKTGIADMAYIPPQPVMSRNDWPTLGEMISSGKRVVIFLDKGAESRTEPEADFILPQFQMMWEDVYDPTDPEFPCKVDRTAGPLAYDQQLNLMNHNLNVDVFVGKILVPDRLNSPRTNSIDSILLHAQHCAPLAENNRPNFVMLDFLNVGQGMDAVDRLNGFHF